jgi:hypothetical protein
MEISRAQGRHCFVQTVPPLRPADSRHPADTIETPLYKLSGEAKRQLLLTAGMAK